MTRLFGLFVVMLLQIGVLYIGVNILNVNFEGVEGFILFLFSLGFTFIISLTIMKVMYENDSFKKKMRQHIEEDLGKTKE